MTPLSHVLRWYDGDDERVAVGADLVVDSLDAGEVPLVCLPVDACRAVRDRVGAHHDEVAYLPADVRYARPIDAMHALWRASRDAAARDRVLHSIGQVPLDGSPADERWFRYERAVNAVLADAALRATCLYDARAVSPERVDEVEAAHDVRRAQARRADAPPLLPRPPGTPLLALSAVADPRTARHAVRGAVAGELAQTLELAVSELVTNAVLHGGGCADVVVWADATRAVVEVADCGAGFADTYADLRPPALPTRGAGLWSSHLLADELCWRHEPGVGTTVRVAISADTYRPAG